MKTKHSLICKTSFFSTAVQLKNIIFVEGNEIHEIRIDQKLTRNHLEIKEKSTYGTKGVVRERKISKSADSMLNQKSNNNINKASLIKHESY